MSQADFYSDGEFATVIAAAAYAVTKQEEKETTQKRQKSVEFSGASLPKAKSKNEETRLKLNSFRGSFKRLFTTGQEIEEEKQGGYNKRAESGKEMKPGPPKASLATKFPTSSFGNRNQDEYQEEEPSKAEAYAEADAWAKEQMIKIKNRYDKMMSMIIEWENEKKEKARSRLERKQNEPESRQARAMQQYEDEIARIEKVAGEARALAEERKRNDETKTWAKAAKIRSTGKLPRACCSCC